MLKGLRGLPRAQLSAPPELDSTSCVQASPESGYDRLDVSAGSHASSHPHGFKLPKGALSAVLFRSSAPAGFGVLVKGTHVESLLLLPGGYDL